MGNVRQRRIANRAARSHLGRAGIGSAYTKFKRFRSTIARGLGLEDMSMHTEFELKVHLARDDESGRWYVAESDIPGLWLEADSATALMDRIADAAPELIDLNQDEILAACLKRTGKAPKPKQAAPARPAIRPIFDSPFELAYG